MTREEAKTWLNGCKPKVIFEDDEIKRQTIKIIEVIDMAVLALDQMYHIEGIIDEIEDGEQQDALKYRMIRNIVKGESE